jgi:hypothetical protein
MAVLITLSLLIFRFFRFFVFAIISSPFYNAIENIQINVAPIANGRVYLIENNMTMNKQTAMAPVGSPINLSTNQLINQSMMSSPFI